MIFAHNGRIHTSVGTAVGIDLCIELVRQDHGTVVANAVARRMATPSHRGSDQAQYLLAPLPAVHASPLGDIATWAIAGLSQPIRMRDLAARPSLSTLHTTPGGYGGTWGAA